MTRASSSTVLARIGAAICVLAGLVGCDVPVRQCVDQTDCFAGEQCAGGECISVVSTDRDVGETPTDAGTDPQPEVGANCRTGEDDPCGQLICNVSTGTCESCQRDAQCGTGELCDVLSGRCECLTTHHRCGSACLPNDSPDSCGSSCDPCESVENATPSCVDGACGFACDDGFQPCDGCGFTRDCIECSSNLDCDDYGKSRCDDGLCVGCQVTDDCGHLDRGLCVDGTCVECDVGQEAVCNGKSCDPQTRRCTQTDQQSRGWCRPCAADSECVPNHRCVPMNFGGSVRPSGYCLQEANMGCNAPNPIQVQRDSLSGVNGEFYCTIREDLTTCEAVLALEDPCDVGSDCGADNINDGLCVFDQCTYRCVGPDECSSGTSCIGNPPDNSYCDRL